MRRTTMGLGCLKQLQKPFQRQKSRFQLLTTYKKKEKWFISTWMSVSQVSMALALDSQLISFLFSPPEKIFKEFGRDLDGRRDVKGGTNKTHNTEDGQSIKYFCVWIYIANLQMLLFVCAVSRKKKQTRNKRNSKSRGYIRRRPPRTMICPAQQQQQQQQERRE